MIDTATPLGFCFAGSVGAVHCVSDMTPKLQGAAPAAAVPMHIVQANITAKTVFKRNGFFINYSPFLYLLLQTMKHVQSVVPAFTG
jgi:hypothetical protein